MILKSEEIFNNVAYLDVIGTVKRFNVESYHIDSRYITKNSAFFAFIGENSDGHNFIQPAFNYGASLVVASYIPPGLQEKLVMSKYCIMLVEDVQVAMEEMAILARSKITAKTICITGSIGKTTTKEMFSFVLGQFFNVSSSFGNRNNHLGLPLSILNADIASNLLILEVGMNHAGEISKLVKIAKPDVSIITTIAPTHIGNFKNLEEVAMAKAEIFEGMNENGIAILNQDNGYFGILSKRAKELGVKVVIGVGKSGVSPVYIENYRVEFGQSNFDLVCKTQNDLTKIPSKTLSISHNIAFNSVFLFTIAKLLKLDLIEVAKYLGKFKGVDGRGNIEKINSNGENITIINDCYNASPDSVKSSIMTLIALKQENPKSRAICILGDMLELGEFSEYYHKENALFISSFPEIDLVHLIGKESKVMHENITQDKRGLWFENAEVSKRVLKDSIIDGDLILLKGSRGIKLETIIDFFYRNS